MQVHWKNLYLWQRHQGGPGDLGHHANSDSSYSPKDPVEDDAMCTEVKIWEEHMKQHMRHKDALTKNLKSAYVLIYGQCSDTLRVKVE